MKYAKGSKEKGLMVMIGIGLSVIAVGGILYAIKDSRAKNKVGDGSDGAVDEPKVDTPQPAKEPAKVPVKAVRSLRGELAGLTNQLDGSKLLVIGDSQVLRSMGQAFLDNVDQSIRAGVDYWGIEGTTPAKIIKRNIEKQTEIGNLLIAKLMKKPPVIVIQLGDNGIMSEQECKRLVLYINSFYPDASKPLIVWSGPFPLCVPSDGSQKYVKGAPCSASDSRCITVYQATKKNNWTAKVKKGLLEFTNVYFVSPYDELPFNKPGVACFTDDGVHISKAAMKEYVNSLLDKELIK